MPQGMGRLRYMELAMDPSAKLIPADHEAGAGFLHFCDDWDFMLIDKSDDEFDCCSCTFGTDYDPQTGKLASPTPSPTRHQEGTEND